MAVVIELRSYYGQMAKLDQIPEYVKRAKEDARQRNDFILTGPAPIWLYLAIARALHGVVRSLYYRSPLTGDVKIFDHNQK